MMMSFGANGLLGLLVVGALVVVPFWRLLPQFGMPNWIALFAIVPVVALVLLWIMAFREPAGRRAPGGRGGF